MKKLRAVLSLYVDPVQLGEPESESLEARQSVERSVQLDVPQKPRLQELSRSPAAAPSVDLRELPRSPGKPLTVDRLQEQLRQVSRANEYYFGVCVVMVMAMFVATLWVALRYAGQADLVTLAFAALGVTMIGMLRVMIGLWREKVATDVLLALAGSLEGAPLRSIIAVLLKRLG